MNFCKECGTLMDITKKEEKIILSCRRCNSQEVSSKDVYIKKEYKLKSQEKVPIIEEISVLPSIKILCKECGNDTAYWWIRQTRSGDEPETKFYRCSKCQYTWREY